MLTVRKYTLLVPVLLCGCATGFDRAALQERLNNGELQINDPAIAEARTTQPQLKMPCRIAVYFQAPKHGDWRWDNDDRAAMESWATSLKQAGIASAVFPLPELLANKGDLKELRLGAAKCGADVLFVVHGESQTDSYLNPAAVLNATIVGGYLIPASHKDSLFMMEGVLVDVDNGYIYTGVQSEGVGKLVRPTFLIEERDSVKRAKTVAVSNFGDELVRRMQALAVNTPPVTSDVPRIRPNP